MFYWIGNLFARLIMNIGTLSESFTKGYLEYVAKYQQWKDFIENERNLLRFIKEKKK